MKEKEFSCLSMKRREGESILISVANNETLITANDPSNIRILVKEIRTSYVRLVILGPRKYPILREEILIENGSVVRTGVTE